MQFVQVGAVCAGEVALKAVEFVQVGRGGHIPAGLGCMALHPCWAGLCSLPHRQAAQRSSKDSCLAAGMALFCCPSRGAAKRTTLEPVTVPPAWPAHSLQTGLPMTGLAVLAGEWRFKPEVMNLLT